MSDETPEAEAAAPREKSALELEMEALLGGAGDVLKGTTEAQGEVRRARRKSKELDEQLQQITSSVEAWGALGALVVPCVAMQPTVGCHGPGQHQRRKTQRTGPRPTRLGRAPMIVSRHRRRAAKPPGVERLHG